MEQLERRVAELQRRLAEHRSEACFAPTTELDCAGVDVLDSMDAPVRGGASTGGIACTIGPDEVHIFLRAPIGDGDDANKSYADAQGGSLENIDRLVGTGDSQPCLSLLVGRDWFILANNEETLRKAERRECVPLPPRAPPAGPTTRPRSRPHRPA